MSKKKRLILILALVFLLILGGIIGLAVYAKTGDIHEAVRKGNMIEVRILLAARPELLNSRNYENRTLLHSAADGHNKEMVEYFLSLGLDVNAKGLLGKTPLHTAAYWGDVDVVELLLSKGAEINALSDKGDTPLAFAADRGNVEAVKFLLSKGADVNIKNNIGATALHIACLKGHREIVQYLLSKNANVAAELKDGRTSLHCAVEHGHIEVCELLLSNIGHKDYKKAFDGLLAMVRDGNKYSSKILMRCLAEYQSNHTLLYGGKVWPVYKLNEEGIVQLSKKFTFNDIQSLLEQKARLLSEQIGDFDKEGFVDEYLSPAIAHLLISGFAQIKDMKINGHLVTFVLKSKLYEVSANYSVDGKESLPMLITIMKKEFGEVNVKEGQIFYEEDFRKMQESFDKKNLPGSRSDQTLKH